MMVGIKGWKNRHCPCYVRTIQNMWNVCRQQGTAVGIMSRGMHLPDAAATRRSEAGNRHAMHVYHKYNAGWTPVNLV